MSGLFLWEHFRKKSQNLFKVKKKYDQFSSQYASRLLKPMYRQKYIFDFAHNLNNFYWKFIRFYHFLNVFTHCAPLVYFMRNIVARNLRINMLTPQQKADSPSTSTLCPTKKITPDIWHMKCDMGHVTRDMWQLTCDT